MKKHFASAAFFSLISKGITVLSMLLLTPVIIDVIGKEQYGLWVLILSIVAWFNLLELGFPSAIYRYATLHCEQKKYDELNLYLSTFLLIFGGLGIISVLLLVLFAFNPGWFDVVGENSRIFTLAFCLFTLKVLVSFLSHIPNSIFVASLRIDIDEKVTAASLLAKLILIYVTIESYGIITLICVTLLVDIFANLIKVSLAYKLLPAMKLHPKKFSITIFREIFSFSKHVFLLGLSRVLNNRIDPFIVVKFLDLKSVAVFNIANNLISQLNLLVFALFKFQGALFTKKVAKNQSAEKLYNIVCTINIYVSLVFSSCVILFAEPFIGLWLGDEFKEAVLLLYILSFTLVVKPITTTTNQLLLAMARHEKLALVQFICAVINIFLSIIFIYSYGLSGVAFATVLSNVLSNVILLNYILPKYTNFNLILLRCKIFYSVVNLGIISYLVFSYHIMKFVSSWTELLLYSILAFILLSLFNLIVFWGQFRETYLLIKR